jgi:hypothetical protein
MDGLGIITNTYVVRRQVCMCSCRVAQSENHVLAEQLTSSGKETWLGAASGTVVLSTNF